MYVSKNGLIQKVQIRYPMNCTDQLNVVLFII